jgi:hypothetical protein
LELEERHDPERLIAARYRIARKRSNLRMPDGSAIGDLKAMPLNVRIV